jgi:ABC-type glycerol-3-phosphate transport system substrate-binding protein
MIKNGGFHKISFLGKATLGLLLVLVLCGCSRSKPASADNSGVSGGAVNKTGYPIMNKEAGFKIVHQIATTDKTGTWQDKEIIKNLLKDTGLNLELSGIPEQSYNEQVGIIIASNELPDVFIGEVPNFAQFIGSFYEITDQAIADYVPTVAEFYNKNPDFRRISLFPDGKMYGLPQTQLDGIVASKALTINKTWLDKLGLSMPNTPDELLNVLTKIKTGDPNGNGRQDEIPYTFHKSTIADKSFGLFLSGFGLVDDDEYKYLMVENGKVFFYPADRRYFEFLQYVHKLNENGLLDPAGFTQEEVDMIAKGSNNLVGLFPNFSYEDITVGVENADDYTYLLPLQDKNGNRHYLLNKIPGGFSTNRFVITKKSEYPEAMLRMYNYVNETFDRLILAAWGPENVAWRKLGDGSLERIASPLPAGYTSFAEIRHSFSLGVKGFYLWKAEDHAKFAVTSDREKKLIARQEPFSQFAVKEYIPRGQNDPADVQEINILLTEIKSYMDNFLAQSVLNGVDETKWNNHLRDCSRMGMDEYVELLQKYYDRITK